MRDIDPQLGALPRHAQYDDVDAVIALAARQDVRFAQLGRGRMRSRYALLTTPNLHLSEAVHSVGAIAAGAVGRGLCAIGVPGDDGPQRHTGGTCGDADAVLAREGSEYLVSSRQGFRSLAVFVRQEMLEEAAEATWGVSLRSLAPGNRLGLASAGERRRLHRLLRATLSPAKGSPGHVGLRRGSDAATEESVVHAILGAARAQERRSDPGRFAAARRAEAMIRDGLADDVSVRRIAMALQTPLRSLEQGFRDLYGTSLRDYLYTLRLNAARRDLVRGAPGETVGAVACRWSLFHLGRFATNYRRRFGETPSETLRAGRSG